MLHAMKPYPHYSIFPSSLLHLYSIIITSPSLLHHHHSSISTPSSSLLHLYSIIITPPSLLHHHHSSISTPSSSLLHLYSIVITPPSLLHHHHFSISTPPPLHLHLLHFFSFPVSIIFHFTTLAHVMCKRNKGAMFLLPLAHCFQWPATAMFVPSIPPLLKHQPAHRVKLSKIVLENKCKNTKNKIDCFFVHLHVIECTYPAI